MNTLADEVSAAHRRLAAAGLAERDAAFDAEVLARHALEWDRATYLTRGRDLAPPAFRVKFDRLVERRCRREPVAHITGVREFWGLGFAVSSEVLIPRPETELLVETALALLVDRMAPWAIADVGTGSGCLATALARELPCARVTASDTSVAAIGVARRNAVTHDVADRISFHATSFFDGLPGPYDLIVSNPPYIPDQEVRRLAPEVSRYEPVAALAGGADGLDPARALVPAAVARLRTGGWLVMEIGAGQSAAVNALARHAGFPLDAMHPDLQGIPRAVVIRRDSRSGN